MNKKWIFLDRDGTLIAEKHYLHDPEEVEILPAVVSGLTKLKLAGYRFVVTTNQSGVGRGYYGLDAMDAVHRYIAELLSEQGIKIEGFFSCPHTPYDNCECRKPKTGLAEQAAKTLGFKMAEAAYVIGDKKCDIDFAANLGVPSVLVMTGYGAREFANGTRGLYNVSDMDEAAEKILGSRSVDNDQQ